MTSHNPERRKVYLQALRLGASKAAAATAAGVARTQPYAWMESDPAFAEQVHEAERASMLVRLARIEKAANNGEWRADAWMLERQFAESFSVKRVEVSGPNGGPIAITADDLASADEATLRAIAAGVNREPDAEPA